MTDRLIWERDGGDWPNRAHSRFVTTAGRQWHVQRFGNGPQMLLVHGTGASTHSWRHLMPLLADRFDVCAIDLPGHGFTDALPAAAMTVPGMAHALHGVLREIGFVPRVIAGHSAGAAIMVRASLDGLFADAHQLIAINGALLPFGGIASRFFSPVAKLAALNPFTPRLFAWRAESLAAVERVITGTGSKIDEDGLKFYARLFRSPYHISAALSMMAGWDLENFLEEMARLTCPLSLIACGNDLAVPADSAFRVADRVAAARVTFLRGLGHLAHEEQPAEIFETFMNILQAERGTERAGGQHVLSETGTVAKV